MKATISRILLVLLAALLCLGLLACTPTEQPPAGGGQPGGSTTNPPGTEGPGEENPSEPEVPHSVPDGTVFSGEDAVVNVLHYTVDGNHENYNPWDEITPATGMDAKPGDTVGNMIFARNAWIEENYGITFTNVYEPHSNLPGIIDKLYQSGDAQYQMVASFQHIATKLIGHDYFLNLTDIEYIDFEDPWWVDSAIEELSLGNFVEFAVSDMLLLDKGATGLMYFNKVMAENLGIDDLYELARNYKWTVEEMAAYGEQAMENTDGDDDWTAADTYGIASGDDMVLFLYCSAGYKFIEMDEKGDYYYSYCYDDGTADAMITILEEVMYTDWFWNTWQHRNDGENPSFQDGQSLFDPAKAKNALSMREMQDDFGVLPIPMLYDGQEQYHSQVSGYHDSMFAIPLANSTRTEVIGAAIELASYFSHYNIQDPFYETILQLRGTRDEESMEMLDMVFSSRTYDLGHLYDPVGVIDKVLRYNSDPNTTGQVGVTGFWETFSGQLEGAIEDLNELKERYNDK